MKKLLLAGLVALGLVAASHQQAAAWCRFKLGASFHTSYISGGKKLVYNSEQPPPPAVCPHVAHPGYSWEGSSSMGTYYGSQTPATSPGQMPQAQVDPSAWYYGSAYQNAGYYQPVGYGYYSPPGYWYGY